MAERGSGHRHLDLSNGLDGHYLVQEFDTVTPSGRTLSGIEYVTWDEDTQSLRAHLMADDGTYWTWFGDKGSDNFSKGR